VPNYVLLLYGQDADWTVGDEAWEAGMAAHEKFSAAVEAAGAAIVGGAALAPPATARTVRGRDRTVSDGPFAETREVLGGFYVIDAPDLDTALQLARECPEDIVEVREAVA
jgi:hypothetical protein